jgi:hypothetical protein
MITGGRRHRAERVTQQLGGSMSRHVGVRILSVVCSVLFGRVGACSLAVAPLFVVMWLMDRSGFGARGLLGAAGAPVAVLGAALLWTSRMLSRLANRPRTGP